MFKDVVGYEDYFQVNELGQVMSKRTNKILVQGLTKNGYKVISSKIGGRKGKAVCLKVHRLVAQTFIPNPENKPFVNHIDAVKTNNQRQNLEWCTNKENSIHAQENGLLKPQRGEDNVNSKLTEADVRKIKQLYVPGRGGFGRRRIALLLGLPEGAVSDVCRGKTWKHIDTKGETNGTKTL